MLQLLSLVQLDDGHAWEYATVTLVELQEIPEQFLTVHDLVEGVGVVVAGGFLQMQYEKDPEETQSA